MSLLTVDGRSLEVQKAALSFEIDEFSKPDQRQVGMEFARLAQGMILRIRNNDVVLVKALKELRSARDSFIKAVS